MSVEGPLCASLIEREKRKPSVFRPPKFVKAIPSQRKTLTATAAPWFPNATVPGPAAPVKPTITPPLALGQSPELTPITTTALPPALEAMHSAASPHNSSLFSPLSTPVHTFFHSFSDEATEEKVYPLDMFLSARKDASHTPHGVLKWCVRQYLEVPSLKVPPHLQLSMHEVVHSEDGVTRGALGSGLKTKTRAKMVRQIHHKVMSILSRITPCKYDELLAELLQLPLRQTDDAELQEVVKVFFDKAVQEPEYSALYAQLVRELCTMKENERELEAELRDRLLSNRMRRFLIQCCEEQFHRPINLTSDEKVDRTTGKSLGEEEIDMKRTRMKNRLVGNIKFVGELFKMSLITERVIEDIFRLLVGGYSPSNPTSLEEYVFEVFATLIKTVAPLLKTQRPYVLIHFLGVAKTVERSHPKPRIHFLMMDLDDLNRKQGWVPADRVLHAAASTAGDAVTYRTPPTSVDTPSLSILSPGDENISHTAAPRSAALPATSMPRSFSGKEVGGTPAPGRSIMTNQSMNSPTMFGASKGQGQFTANPSKPNSPPAALNPPAALGNAPPPALNFGLEGSITSFNVSDSANRTPLTRSCNIAEPPMPIDVINIQDIVQQLIACFKDPAEEGSILRCLNEMSLKNKVLCLTWWLRELATNTALFEERQQVAKLFSAILTSCPSLNPEDLLSAVLEWIRFDIEKAEYDECPRMFDNVAHMILYCYSEEASKLAQIDEVRHILHAGIFNVMLHELTTESGTDQMVTLVKSAQPIAMTILQTIRDPAEPAAVLRVAVQNRFRLLPYFLSVSNGTDSELPGTPTHRIRTPNSPALRVSSLGDSITSTGHYDPLSQCLAFPKLADDAEFFVFRKIRAAGGEGDAWKEEAIKAALAPVGDGSQVAQAVQMMKVIGALLACTGVSRHEASLIGFGEVDAVVSEILSRQSGPVFEAAAVVELIMHFTQSLSRSEDSPRKSTRIKPLRQALGRWCSQGIIHKDSAMGLVRALDVKTGHAKVYSTYHNAVAASEIPWHVLLTCV